MASAALLFLGAPDEASLFACTAASSRLTVPQSPRIEAVWDRLDAELSKRGPYLLGEKISMLDFYATILMRWSRNMPKPATEWPHLGALAQRMKARPSFRTLYEREGLTDWT